MVFSFYLGMVQGAFAFNVATHHQILKDALLYLRTHVSQHPLTSEWLTHADQIQSATNSDPLQRLLIRSIIDADYQDDLWLDAWYFRPFSGGKTQAFAMLTSLYHFTNVTHPGRYWRYDGYAYQNTDGLGNDSFLGIPWLVVRFDMSKPMQKYASTQGKSEISLVTLPPSYLLARDAFDDAIHSSITPQSQRQTWTRELTYTENYIFNASLIHRYAREEIAGLPWDFQKLGTAIHMAQDLAMPHHAQGIAGLCHSELESAVDEFICAPEQRAPNEIYGEGSFDEFDVPDCQGFKNMEAVEKLIASDPTFSIASGVSLEQRLIQIAQKSADFQIHAVKDRDPDAMMMSNQNKLLFNGACQEIASSTAMAAVAQRQFQLATAATVMLIELAALEYTQFVKASALAFDQCHIHDNQTLAPKTLA